jgi:predicted esterase YcpF (UPF0227 family)
MIVYLHGFNSAPSRDSDKVQMLLRSGEEVLCLGYDSFSKREDNLISLRLEIAELDRYRLVVVGTSLGAYYAAEVCRRLEIPCVLINPCVDPFFYLSQQKDVDFLNYVTGQKRRLTAEVIESYRGFPIRDSGYFYRPLLLLDLGDEVMSSVETSRVLAGFEVIKYPGGSHRFCHMELALPEIMWHLTACSFVCDLNS